MNKLQISFNTIVIMVLLFAFVSLSACAPRQHIQDAQKQALFDKVHDHGEYVGYQNGYNHGYDQATQDQINSIIINSK